MGEVPTMGGWEIILLILIILSSVPDDDDDRGKAETDAVVEIILFPRFPTAPDGSVEGGRLPEVEPMVLLILLLLLILLISLILLTTLIVLSEDGPGREPDAEKESAVRVVGSRVRGDDTNDGGGRSPDTMTTERGRAGVILSPVGDGERRAGFKGGKPVPSDVDDIPPKRGGSPREAQRKSCYYAIGSMRAETLVGAVGHDLLVYLTLL